MRTLLAILFFSAATLTLAQDKPPKQPDVLVFTNGDKLTGTLVRAVGSNVIFKSDMAGELTIPYSKIKELTTQQPFAVIAKGKRITRKTPDAEVPQGIVSIAEDTITVGTAPATVLVPVAKAVYVVDDTTYQHDVRGTTGFLQGWNGAVTLGASLVKATQNNYGANAAIAVVRTIPQAAYIDPRNRTTAGFTFNYGEVTTPVLLDGVRVNQVARTDIYHAEAERDEYVTRRVFVLGRLAYDHNFSQGLKLAQTYGGGVGWTVILKPKQQLDLKADVHYVREDFFVSSQNQNLIAIGIGDNYLVKLPRNMVLTQFLTVSPSVNNIDATAAVGGVNLAAPFSKKLAFSAGVTDSFINNPGFLSPGIQSKKNSVQVTTGLTYTLR